jgi:GDP-L-fucose synthase
MNIEDKIYVAGHKGLVGSEIFKKLEMAGYQNIITATHKELDLTRQESVEHFFETMKPDYVFLAAAKVGGIYANSTFAADFTYENLMVECNVVKACHDYGVKKLLMLGSSCIYPRNCPQPIKEEYLLTGPLEKTNEGYAISKIAGITMCQKFNFQYGTNFISVMPTNLYGCAEHDNYDPKTSHVLPGMIYKFHKAKMENSPTVELWGTGSPLREFLHVSDMADAVIFLMENYNDDDIINIGSGKEVSIKKLADIIKEIVQYKGEIIFNSDYPDGTPRKFLDSTKLRNLGWEPRIDLYDGIDNLYQELIKIKKFDI